ncbi:MAG: hypothetical protein GWM90_20510, partial [Gemmatimonadetes bacterium]|nr:hypothetical protein [Gemmatimonadota bacterium]NIQ56857.1 hypothetical protein [Gemmatimonadota bacterium]NIU77040.1 hypothetical protein [Gammaproteobacteria bacterium]NIX46381.1 hypothetical protein [Gemmatimonadota bacterium]NIY10699.1 hypothetical protein [Gemmatimonadota bacterium]
DSEDPTAELATLRAEVEEHSTALAEKPFCVVLTKADLLGPDDDPPAPEAPGAWASFLVSAVAGRGIDEWKEAVWQRVRGQLDAEREAEEEPEPWRP